MDKKTIWIVIVCFLVLFAGQRVVDMFFPPKPKKPRPTVETSLSNATPAVVQTSTPVATAAIDKSPAEPEKPLSLPPERIVTLSNNFVRVEVTSWGGGIRLVELLHHMVNGKGNVELNGTGTVPALTVEDVL